jgi:glycosyltransferase involved in cell wall biosynthesis
MEHSSFLQPFVAKCIPIWPPVVVATPAPDAVRRWRQELGVGDAPIVGFAGRFVEEKGFDFLLKAIPLLARDIPAIQFAYAGERNVVYERFLDVCRPLIKPVESHILWLGLLTDPQRLADFYAMCDVIAVPSRTDNLPLVPLEAILCGTPAVITDIPGARMAVKVSQMGLLVRPGDEVALAGGLREVLTNRSHYIKPAAEIAGVFGLERSLDEYERALTQFAARGEEIVPSPPRRIGVGS